MAKILLKFQIFRPKEVEQAQFLLNHLPQQRDKSSQQDLNPTKTEWEGLKNPPQTVPGNTKFFSCARVEISFQKH